MSRVLLADHDSKQRAFLGEQLSARGYSVNAVQNGDQALRLLLATQPDLALIASELPQLTGNQICRQLRESGGATPVVQLLADDRRQARVHALQAGADYAIACPVALDELLASMQALLRRNQGAAAVPSPNPSGESALEVRHGDLVVHLNHTAAERAGRDLGLTAREHALLVYLIRHRGSVCSRANILANVWGRPWESTNNLLDVYVGYLRRKLDQAGEEPMLRTVRGVGFILT
jgi:two-component system response regulator MprA